MSVEEKRLRALCYVLLSRYIAARDIANCQIFDRVRYESETRILEKEQALWDRQIEGERRDPMIDHGVPTEGRGLGIVGRQTA